MKKSLLIFFIVILLMPLALSLQTTFKQEYQPGETILAQISGNFLDSIKSSYISIYSNRTFIPMPYDIAKIQDVYYFYGILPDRERNYTLTIKNVHYTELGIEKTNDLMFNFSAVGNESLFSVNPGFIVASGDFEISVTSKVKNINIRSSFLNSSKETLVKEGKTEKIIFSTYSVSSQTFTTLTLSSENQEYDIPVYILKKSKPIDYSLPLESLNFSKKKLNITLIKNVNLELELEIINKGQTDIQDIKISSDLKDIINLVPNNITLLAQGESASIHASVKSTKEGLFAGKIEALSGNLSSIILVYINSAKDSEQYNQLINNTGNITTYNYLNQSCESLQGEFCSGECASDKIKLTPVEGGDKICCLDGCKTTSSSGKTIALVVIIIAVLGILALLFFKYKKRGKSKTTKEIIRDRTKEFEERFKSQEVRGDLSKT